MQLKVLLPVLLMMLLSNWQGRKIEVELTPLEVFADSLFQASLDSAQIAGGAILVYQNGDMLLKKSYGYGSLELSVPMPEEAQFEIGSVTKQFTATAILKLVEAGKISLDDDFTKYLAFDTGGRTITIGQLLDHTSGIPSYTEIPAFWQLSIEQHPRDTLVRMMEGEDFLFEPGEALIYNNSAYFFLGLIIEKVSEQSYEEYLQRVIFEPLGMSNTHYCSTTEVVKNKVYGYNYSPEGLKQKPYLNHTWPFAAGSLCSSTADLLTWMTSLHEEKVLPTPLYQALTTPGKLKDGTPVRYAKGLTNFLNFGNREIGHGGGINGFLSSTAYFPDENLYVICLINTTGPKGPNFFAEEITWKLLKKHVPQGVDLDVDTKALVGKYTGMTRGREQTIEVKSISEGLELHSPGSDQVDSIRTYIGNSTWRDGNRLITILKDELRSDQISGYYILKKEEK